MREDGVRIGFGEVRGEGAAGHRVSEVCHGRGERPTTLAERAFPWMKVTNIPRGPLSPR
jgi:hypothetical protein